MAAVEFFPSPITATLLAFLGRFSSGFALREDLGDYDLLNPSSAARRKQVLLEEGWPRGELPSKVGLREHMQLALRCGIRWAWPTMAMLRADAGHRASGPHAEQNLPWDGGGCKVV